MKGIASVGKLPYKVDESFNLQSAFRNISQQIILQMFEILDEVSLEDYPFSNYSLSEDENGISESGIQISIESDCFGQDNLMLRRHINGYTIALHSLDDCTGIMEYEFDVNDPLARSIPDEVKKYLDSQLYL